jgi:dihydrofolate reductase
MRISLIVAMDENGAIGKDGGLPWRQSADLKRFKHLTLGHVVIMGRKTWQSIGKVLPGRIIVVVTRQADYHAEGVQVVHTLEEALEVSRAQEEKEVFVIGGAQLFNRVLSLANRIYLTRVHTHIQNADAFFPAFEVRDWQLIHEEQQSADAKNQYPTTFQVWKRHIP